MLQMRDKWACTAQHRMDHMKRFLITMVLSAVALAPFMAPAIGISLGTIAGTVGFILQSLGSLSIGSLIVFLCGMVSGWAVHLLPQRIYTQAILHSRFTWPDFIVLALGAGLTAFLIVRSPHQKPLVTSIAIAYELYLPAGVAGFGLSSGIGTLWLDGTNLFITHLVWAALIGVLALSFLGLRPINATGYLLGMGYLAAGLVALTLIYPPQPPVMPSAQAGNTAGVEIQRSTSTPPIGASPTISPTATQPTATITPTVTPTRTLVPTKTPTMTITSVPTPVWARISATEGNGALVRAEANYNASVVSSVLNGTLVEVLPEVVTNGGVAWVHIRLVNGKEGWIVRSLLRTATPAPSW
ncbi:MAG: DUF389 domain-containing protein [Chloroflexi bacterium]|nr:MAG: DUF389 domain-containing protein [Chloroflexota bacterium]